MNRLTEGRKVAVLLVASQSQTSHPQSGSLMHVANKTFTVV